MATNLQVGPETNSEPGLAALLSGIVRDVQELLKQQLALFKHEVRQDVERAKEGVLSLAFAVPFVLLGGILLCLMLVFVLHEVAGLPLWGSFGIIGGTLILVGMALALLAWQRLDKVAPLSGPTAEGLKENLEWTTNPQ
jgi:hypothetical protein